MNSQLEQIYSKLCYERAKYQCMYSEFNAIVGAHQCPKGEGRGHHPSDWKYLPEAEVKKMIQLQNAFDKLTPLVMKQVNDQKLSKSTICFTGQLSNLPADMYSKKIDRIVIVS